MRLHQLRSLIAVSETGSIKEAARRLHISQPAVSKALSDLEAYLGAPLLVRSAKGTQLTLYGISLIRHARAIEQELRHAHEDIASMLGEALGTLVVGVTPVTSAGPFAEALRRFFVDYPEVSVNIFELRPAQIQEGLADGSIDFGLASYIGQPSDTRTYWETLYTIPTTLAVSKNNPLRGICSLGKLAQQNWLSWDAPDDPAGMINAMFSSQGIAPPKHVVRCTSPTLYEEIAATTDLISIWSELPFHKPTDKGQIRKISTPEPLPEMRIGLICRDINLTTTIATTFINMLREACKEPTGLYRSAGATSAK